MIQLDNRLGGQPQYIYTREYKPLMQVPNEVRDCVAFLMYETFDGKKERMAGTVFFVHTGDPIGGSFGGGAVYAITARHVIDQIKKYSSDGMVRIRLNNDSEETDTIKVNCDDWLFHPYDETVDVAVLRWNFLDPNMHKEIRVYPIAVSATQEVMEKNGIGIGDETCSVGLFHLHAGTKRNIPILRIGNIAAMPEEKVHSGWKGGTDIEALLIESRSIGGLSGSPVFVHLYDTRYVGQHPDDPTDPRHNELARVIRGSFYLIGLMHGHWDASDLSEVDGVDIDTVGGGRVNVGIGIVVPVNKIIEVIRRDDLRAEREKASEREKQARAATID